MGLVIAQGIEALDLSIYAPPPIGMLCVPLAHGLTVLYGENGAGKTTVLEQIRCALTGVKPPRGAEVHLRCRLTRAFVEPEPSDPLLLGLLALLVERQGVGGVVTDEELLDFEPYVDLIPNHPDWEDGFDGSYWYGLSTLVDELGFGLDDLIRRWSRGGSAIAEWSTSWPPDRFDHSMFDSVPLGTLDPAVAVELKLALLESLGGETQLVLVPVGSEAQPTWDVYPASMLPDTAALRACLTAISTRENGTRPWEDRAESKPWFADCLRLANSPFEEWPLRLFKLGSIAGGGAVNCLRPSDGFDPDRELVPLIGFDRRHTGQMDEVNLLASATDHRFEITPAAEETIRTISENANRILHRALGPGRSLGFRVNHPGRWVTSGFGQWFVEDGRLDPIPLAFQGSAVRRWGTIALELAYREYASLRPLVLLVDEPENALHPAAQVHLAESLAFDDSGTGIAESVFGCIVATHSPALLAVQDAHLLHVARTFDGGASIVPIEKIGEVDALVSQLGVTRADVLAMTNGFVLVEGHHDEIVLNTLFGDDFARLRARVVRMDGALNAKAALNVELLATYSPARLVLVVDRIGPRAVASWQEAQDAAFRGDSEAASRALHRMSRVPGAEAEWVIDAGLHAVKAGTLHRIRLVGLRRPDIIEYLPVDGFVEGAASWDELRRDYAASSDRRPFKDWLRTHRRARITPATVSAAAARIANLEDLPQVLQALL